jgi:hypothetical protein
LPDGGLVICSHGINTSLAITSRIIATPIFVAAANYNVPHKPDRKEMEFKIDSRV